ncbi:MAG: YebC/PmpR family DNA-binding transcriptional regulator [Saprospiraceae bacterium]
MGRAFEFRKARKMKRWGQMAKTFSRLGKDLVIAIKEGGGIADPESNSKLRAVLQNCRAANMPKDNVERAIKKATDKDTSDYKEVILEGYGPHGIAMLVETATDSNKRTVANVRSYFNKCDGSLGTQGSVSFMFDRKCQFKISNNSEDLEELEFELIDFGAEEVFEDEEGIMIYADFSSFGKLQNALEKMNKEILSSGFEQIPNVAKKLTSPDEIAAINKLIDRIEEDDDVQNVYHTMIEEESEV